ncbi:hypothetical protein STRDD11_02428 [Streptococcus sp. DD11]|nr:hypothetical protein STRDD11_02428 [Streptococcus sp. DD11]
MNEDANQPLRQSVFPMIQKTGLFAQPRHIQHLKSVNWSVYPF